MFFENIQSYEDLKNQFKELAKKNHPDAGGDPEVMKAINAEFDRLQPIWLVRRNQTCPFPIDESADMVRNEFYTQSGWAGTNYKASRSTKEICQLIRSYVKETYPTYKFSVRFQSASMCSEIYVQLVNSPIEIYKTYEELTKEERWGVWRKAEDNHWVERFGCLDDEHDALLKDAYEKHSFLKVYNEVTATVIKDVDRFVNSYRMEDCDGMIDYFDVSDYYFGCQLSDKFAVVPKTARVKSAYSSAPAAKEGSDTTALPDAVSSSEYEICKTEHTKTHEPIWTVKVLRKLDRDEYKEVEKSMKALGGYYSRFVHAFVFKEDPSERLGVAA